MQTKTRNPFARKTSFALGTVTVAPAAQALIEEHEILAAITRHARGDWGEVSETEWKENELALANGYQLLSSYSSAAGETFWVVTHPTRSHTTVMLPDEY